jgi:hypothetical protein
MHPVFLVIAAASFVMLALLGLARRPRRPGRGLLREAAARRRTRCPVCGTLQPEGGGGVRTAAFPGAAERLVHIYGCPSCYGPAARLQRRCPVCRSRLEGEDHLVGVLVAAPGGTGAPARGRVSVRGCSRCAGQGGRRGPPTRP